jgi:hypothetical protein
MKHTFSFCIVLSIACVLCGSVFGETVFMEDTFDSDHVYFDGSSVDVSGTGWTGIFGTQFLDWMNANISNASCLSIKLKATGDATAIDGTNYRFPFLYTDVTGDFTAEMIMKNPIPADYIIYLLGVIDIATSNDYMGGSFPVAGPNGWGFYDYQAAHAAGNRELDAGLGPYVTNNLCYRVDRVGDEFTLYSRVSSMDPWNMSGQYTYPTTLPATMSVGLLVCEHILYGNMYEFDYFKVGPVIPEPGIFGAVALGFLMLIRRK